MKLLLMIFLAAMTLKADGLALFVHTPGQAADGPALGSSYAFPDTAVGNNSTVVLRLKNTSTSLVYLVRVVYVSDPSFSVGGSVLDMCLASGQFEDLTVSFTPSATGPFSTPLSYGYSSYSVFAGCPSTSPQNVSTGTLATLTGNGVTATLTSTLTIGSHTTPLASGNAIAFSEVPVGSTQQATVTFQNASTATLPLDTPSITTAQFQQSPFTLGSLATWPATLAPGATASFTLTFAPTQQALVQNSTLNVGTRSYPLSGVGIPGEGLSSLLISYTLPTGVHYTVTPASPIDFGSALTGSSGTFIFTISNPLTNFSAQTISPITVSGAGFSLASLPSLPVTVKPGESTAFNVVYSPTAAGTVSGTLTIGTLQFALSGKATNPALNPTFQITPAAPVSAQQAQLSFTLSAPAKATSIGALTLSFTSEVTSAADDPAVQFVSTSSRKTNVTFAAGSTTGTFPDGTASATFQTGTTHGTLTFTLSFANGESYTKSVDIAQQTVQITSASATRQSPSIVLNLSAFDNTYSASKILFNFYGSNGASLTPGGITYDGTSAFHNYFFTNNQAGGAFSLQASFPVTGDITSVTAADITVQNTSGQSQTQHVTF